MRESRLSSLLPISDAAATLQALFSKVLSVFITPTTLSILVSWHRISPTGSFSTRFADTEVKLCGWHTSRSVTCAPCREISSVVRRCRKKASRRNLETGRSQQVVHLCNFGSPAQWAKPSAEIRPAFLGTVTDCSPRLADGRRTGTYEVL